MSGWILWVLAAAAFGTGEMLTGGFFLAPFSLGAALAALLALLGAGSVLAWIMFVLGSLLALGLVRPFARAHTRTAPGLRTGAAALIGEPAIVLERIANGEGAGCVKIGGEVWTARALYDEQVIEPGTRVEVVQIKGATALVSE